MRWRGRPRPSAGRRLSPEEILQVAQRARETIALETGKLGQERTEPGSEHAPGRSQDALSLRAQAENASPPIRGRIANHQTRRLQRGKKLRDGGSGDRSPVGQVGRADLSAVELLEGEVLRHREWGLVCRERALDPPAHLRRNPGQQESRALRRVTSWRHRQTV